MVRKSKQNKKQWQRWLIPCFLVSLIVGISGWHALGQAIQLLGRVISAHFVIDSVNVQLTEFHSSLLQQQLLFFVNQKTANANFLFFNKTDFYISLRKQFSNIEKIYISRSFSRGIKVHIVGVKPAYLINDTHVLAHNKELYEKSLFSDWEQGAQHRVYADINKLGADALAQMYTDLELAPASLFLMNAITYVDSTHIELRPLFSSDWAMMLAKSSVLPNERLIEIVPNVIKDMYQRGFLIKTKSKNKKQLLVDLRFDKRIIVKVLGECKQGRWG